MSKEENKIITRDEILEYFREDHYIEGLSLIDRYEIALSCMAHSDYFFSRLKQLIARDAVEEFQKEKNESILER